MARLDTLTPELKGRKYPAWKFEIRSDAVHDYKQVIGYSAQLCADTSFVPPTFLTSLRAGEFHIFSDLNLELSQLLHASHHYDFHRPLRNASTLMGQVEIADLKHKSGKAGEVVFLSLHGSYRDPESELVAETNTLVIVRPLDASAVMPPFTEVKLPAGLPHISTSIAKLKDYARVSGDHNPIHTDPEVAKRAGLAGAIAHGMYGFDQLFRVACEQPQAKGLTAKSAEARFMAMIPSETGFAVEAKIQEPCPKAAKLQVNTRALLNPEIAATSLKVIF